jgi:hypothetical protein
VAAAIECLGGLSFAVAAAPLAARRGLPRRPPLLRPPRGAPRRSLHAALVGRAWIAPADGRLGRDGGGEAGLDALGVDLGAARRARRFACDCMDWSERRPHLAGGLGREIAACCLRRHWLGRSPPEGPSDPLARRRLALTPEGARRLRDALGVSAA